MIARNVIRDNHDGIVCCTSSPEIINNRICSNKRNGVTILKDSRPKMFKNWVGENSEVGIYIKDKSKGVYERNRCNFNGINLIVEQDWDGLDDIHEKNDIVGNMRTARTFKCSIM